MTAPSVVALDANTWGRVVAPGASGDFRDWYQRLLQSGRAVVLPEIADYEVRRSLRLLGIGERRWAEYEMAIGSILYAPISTPVMRRAADVWADARRSGRPFAASERLDGDSILIAQAEGLGTAADVVVATTNVRHIRLYVQAAPWTDLVV